MKYVRSSSILALMVASLCGCPEIGTQERTLTSEIPEAPTWLEHVKPIMDTHCNECHSVPPASAYGWPVPPANFRFDVCETVAGIGGAQAGRELVRQRVLDKLGAVMPPPNYPSQPTNDEYEILTRWIDLGGPCDRAATNSMVNNVNSMQNNVMDTGAMTGMDMGVDPMPDMPPDLPDAAPTWTMIANQLISKCSVCHENRMDLVIASDTDAAGLANIFDGTTSQRPAGMGRAYVVPNDPQNSELWLRLDSADDMYRMPRPIGTPKDVVLAQQVFDWIMAGADFTN